MIIGEVFDTKIASFPRRREFIMKHGFPPARERRNILKISSFKKPNIDNKILDSYLLLIKWFTKK